MHEVITVSKLVAFALVFNLLCDLSRKTEALKLTNAQCSNAQF